jgi:hypothetical protein
VSKTLETKPQLVQISSAWNSREGAPLGKNRYMEIEIKKAKTNGTGSKIAPQQKPCQKMTEAVVMDGGRRGEVVKVCADLSCRVHHPDTPSPEQVAKERADERRRIEKSKQAITIRHCVLAKVLERVGGWPPSPRVRLICGSSFNSDQCETGVPHFSRFSRSGLSRRRRRSFFPIVRRRRSYLHLQHLPSIHLYAPRFAERVSAKTAPLP